MSNTETLPPLTQPEQEGVRSERLTQEKLRRELAAIALLAIIMAEYQKNRYPQAVQEGLAHLNENSHIFSLLDYSINPPKVEMPPLRDNREVGMQGWRGAARGPMGGASVTHNAFTYRERIFAGNTHAGATGARFSPESDSSPAPAMSEQPVGPQLPDLPFNDRIRPQNQSPSKAEFAAADRANEMYQRALWDTGWRGGEATPDQQKSAALAMARQFHPDTGAAADDVEAFKMFNSNNNKPTTAPKKGPPPSEAGSSDAESAPGGASDANSGPAT